MLDLILRQRNLVRLCIYDSMPPAWSTGAYTEDNLRCRSKGGG